MITHYTKTLSLLPNLDVIGMSKTLPTVRARVSWSAVKAYRPRNLKSRNQHSSRLLLH